MNISYKSSSSDRKRHPSQHDVI